MNEGSSHLLKARHFGVGETIENLQRYFTILICNDKVSKFFKGCVIYRTNNLNNKKVGLNMPLSVPCVLMIKIITMNYARKALLKRYYLIMIII